MKTNASLPPGQYESANFPRFGLTQFASRFPTETARIQVRIIGDVRNSVTVGSELERVARGVTNKSFRSYASSHSPAVNEASAP